MENLQFITPINPLQGISTEGVKEVTKESEEAGLFKSILNETVNNVVETQTDVENKQYLLATGQLSDAHTLPIAEAKAQISLDLMVTLRNKALESYNELIKMSV